MRPTATTRRIIQPSKPEPETHQGQQPTARISQARQALQIEAQKDRSGRPPSLPSNPNPAARHIGNPQVRCLSRACRSTTSAKLEAIRSTDSGRPSRRPILARLRRAAAACMEGRQRLRSGRPDAFGALAGQSVQRKCATPGRTSSGCCRRRTWPVPAAYRGGRSIGRSPVASCGRHGCVTGFGFIRRSWSVGSPRKPSQRIRRRRRDPGGVPGSWPADCERCSMRRGEVGAAGGECRTGRAEGWSGLARPLARRAGPGTLEGDRPEAGRRRLRRRGREAEADWRPGPALWRAGNARRLRPGVVEALRRPQSRGAHSPQLRGAVGPARPAPARLDAAQRDHAGSRRALPGRAGSRRSWTADRLPGARSAPGCAAARGRVAAHRAQPGQDGAEAEDPQAARGPTAVTAHRRAAPRCGRQQAQARRPGRHNDRSAGLRWLAAPGGACAALGRCARADAAGREGG
jgi:hypothetical protein